MAQDLSVPSRSDYLTIGGGIIGLTMARALHAKHPDASITVIEKEPEVAQHASGRNSGVLHAGFYYSPESLKAKFCRDGNLAMREFVASHNLRINDCGKVVVARDASELGALKDLYDRGIANGVKLEWVDEKRLAQIEPNAKTTQSAIYSPTTAIVDPIEICQTIRKELQSQGVKIFTNMPYEGRIGGNVIRAGGQPIEAGRIINCAGVFADRVAKDFGFCEGLSITPFKGIYLEYTGDKKDSIPSRCVYGVPDPKNPFLGVHFSVTVDGKIKIGPTAMPVLGRENYQGIEGVSVSDATQIIKNNLDMFFGDKNYRHHAWAEIRKYRPGFMVSEAARMVKNLDKEGFASYGRAGIRAQLMQDRTHQLLHDFVVEGDNRSTHVLNAVSPAFTSSIPFAQWIVENYIEKTPPAPAHSYAASLNKEEGRGRG